MGCDDHPLIWAGGRLIWRIRIVVMRKGEIGRTGVPRDPACKTIAPPYTRMLFAASNHSVMLRQPRRPHPPAERCKRLPRTTRWHADAVRQRGVSRRVDVVSFYAANGERLGPWAKRMAVKSGP